MTTIAASAVRKLRQTSGAGMMDCKQALKEMDGDFDRAISWLRKKGLSKAAKKSGRIVAEGLIGVVSKKNIGSLVEVNSETDFVARNDLFQELVSTITQIRLAEFEDHGDLLSLPYPNKSLCVGDYIKELIATIGENIEVRRSSTLCVKEGVVADYVHNKAAEGLGKIGVLVALESSGDLHKLMAFGRQLAMHIAATAPLALSVDELDVEAISKERAIYYEQAKSSGKPPAIIDKIVEGRLRKEFFQQVVLPQQTFVVDGKMSVEQAVKLAEKDIDAPINIAGFIRYGLGDGIQKEEDNFAADVAAVAGRS
ncbi:MAG: elongation factor Ts [Hyphomicrobiaceae bacterium]|nr:elongation factor Ts [Hyphomicrobiaceae bacterium]